MEFSRDQRVQISTVVLTVSDSPLSREALGVSKHGIETFPASIKAIVNETSFADTLSVPCGVFKALTVSVAVLRPVILLALNYDITFLVFLIEIVPALAFLAVGTLVGVVTKTLS